MEIFLIVLSILLVLALGLIIDFPVMMYLST